MKTYTVSVNFGGYIGCDEEYTVDANSEEEAIDLAMDKAMEDLSFEVVGVEEAGVWDVDSPQEASKPTVAIEAINKLIFFIVYIPFFYLIKPNFLK